MPYYSKHTQPYKKFLRDVRPASQRMAEYFSQTNTYSMVALLSVITLTVIPETAIIADAYLLAFYFYTRWLFTKPIILPFKMPLYANELSDTHNPVPGKAGAGKSEGILFLGNVDDKDSLDHGRELWLTNSDARTHTLFLGTTGSGKTEGLKSLVTNSLSWGSGFVYVDGKADTDLWVSLYALARRFGRDDDLLVLNYMTANSDDGATSNTMNPFSNGSASYLSNMIISLMPDAGGDNAMWKERAVALMFALMPALTYKRDKEGLLLDVGILRNYIELPAIIRLSRDPNLPERIVRSLQGYLNTLPGYVDAAFDDEGNERPPSPDQPMYDLQVARQQHGYLSMQFTRSLQSLADEYGYIFKVQLADIDVLDVVLNRRILVALIPALEKSGDEAANLGKIIAASLKGMMGATLGNTVEGSWENAIGSKQTRSNSSFMTVFDEVGYYTAQGMAVMAAQARSLGFSLIFAAQDIPSMEKRVKQEAQSILGNCNLKIFGKLEDPLDTKKFFQDHVGTNYVIESKGFSAPHNTISSMFMHTPYHDDLGAGSGVFRVRADYDHLRNQREGEVHMLYAEFIVRARMFHAVADKVKALRVHRLLPVPATTQQMASRERSINELTSRLKDPDWTVASVSAPTSDVAEISTLADNWNKAMSSGKSALEAGIISVVSITKLAADKPKSKLQTSSVPSSASSARASASYDKQPSTGTTTSRMSPPSGIPLQEGDEFAFSELETYETSATNKLSGDGPSFAHTDMTDTSIVVRPGETAENEDMDVLKFKLPEGISGLLEKLAHKLNRGLGGSSHSDKVE